MIFFFNTTPYRTNSFTYRSDILDGILGTMEDALVICNDKGVIVKVNDAFRRVVPDFEFVIDQTDFLAFIRFLRSNALYQTPSELLDESIALQREDISGEFSIKSPGSRARTFAVTDRRIVKGQRFTGRVVMLNDVSDYRAMINDISFKNARLVELKEVAESASEAKSALLANTTHEIRTAIHAIVGMDDLLLQTELSVIQRDYADSIRSVALALLSIVNDMLDISKMEAGKLSLYPATYSLEPTIDEITKMIGPRLTADIALLVEIAPDLPTQLMGDETRVRQILLNLLSNAAKCTKSGYIKLGVSHALVAPDRTCITFTVEDSGIGIPAARLPELFRAFQQVDSRRDQAREGTGLGLSIAQRLAWLMEGDIAVSSIEGQGTTFTVQIIQELSPQAPPAAIPLVPDTLRVLVCEPNAHARSSLMHNLNAYRVQAVDIADTVNEALDMLTKREYTHLFVASMFCHAFVHPLAHKTLIVALFRACEPIQATAAHIHAVQLPILPSTLCDYLNNTIRPRNAASQANVPWVAPTASVLIVDDNQINLQVALGLLAPYEMRLDQAINGYEAIEKVLKHDYDLVFMDHMMPGLDGIDTTKHIRSQGLEALNLLPIVALTANAVPGMKSVFTQAGMNDLVVKPISRKELERVLVRWLPKEKRRIKPSGHELQPRARPAHKRQSGSLINRRMALTHYFDNNATIYRNVVARFIQSGPGMLEEIEQLALTQALETLVVKVHTLKGNAATLGASELSKEATALEMLGRANNLQAIESRLPAFIDLFNHTLTELSAMNEKYAERT